MPAIARKLLVWAVVLAVVAGLAVLVVLRLVSSAEVDGADDAEGPVPVEVGAVERGTIQDRRVFSGTLAPRAQFIVSPKVSGRVESLHVDIGDPVVPGQLIAELDDDEFVQAVAQADAELAVARAELAQARSALEIASREFERIQTLRQRNVASESDLDAAQAAFLASEAQVEVAAAEVQRAEAALASERVRLSYTDVAASWTGGGDERIVSERYLDEGGNVAANDPIVTVVDNSSVRAVLFVTGQDYGRLAAGQPVTVETDAYPGRTFEGRVLRLAPVFEESSRQARVEIDVPNPDRSLKPGMFVRAAVVLGRADDATIAPAAAVTRRDGESGLFVLSDGGDRVRWVAVDVGIADGDRVQITGDGVSGRVVTLGQQLLTDGSAVRVATEEPTPQ